MAQGVLPPPLLVIGPLKKNIFYAVFPKVSAPDLGKKSSLVHLLAIYNVGLYKD